MKSTLFLALVVNFVAMMVVDHLLFRRHFYRKYNDFESSFFFWIERNKTVGIEEIKMAPSSQVTYENITELIYSKETDWILNDKNSSILKKKKNNPNAPRIPKIIFKTFYTKSGQMPPLESFAKPQRDALSSWLVRNPGYEMKYFGLDDSRLYLKKHFHPIFLRAFDCIEPFAGKSDMFRAAIIYREGGYYSDFKEQLQVDGLLDLMANSSKPTPAAIISWDRGTPHARQNYYVMTGFFGAIAGHPSEY